MLNKASTKMKENAKKHDITLRNQKEKKQKEEKQFRKPQQQSRDASSYRPPMASIPSFNTSLSTDGGVSMRTLDLRCRYWIDQRLAQLLMNDNFTTRGAYSFAIRNGELTFEREGQTLATINSNGEFHGTNVFISGINVMAAIRELQRIINISGDLPDGYVRHYQLKNGTYELDVKSIISKDATLKHLLVQPDADNSLEYKTNDGDYSLLLTTSDPEKGMGVLCPSVADNTDICGLRFGKATSTNNAAQLRFRHSSDGSTGNSLRLGLIGTDDTIRVYGDRSVYIRTGNTLNYALVCRHEGNLGNNQYIRMGCGDYRDIGIMSYSRANNENYVCFKLQGRSAQMKLYATRTELDADTHFQINSTKTSGAFMYVIGQNITAGSYGAIVVGQDRSNNNSASFGYYRQGGAITKPLGYLGFFGNDGVITYDTDGYTTIKTTKTDQDMLNLHTSGTLTNTKYIRQLFSDSTGQAVIDLFHDSQYYGLRLKVPTDNANDNKLCIYPTGIAMDGAVDIYDDLTLWQKLYVNSIYPASNSTVSVYGNLTLANAANILTCSNIVANALASTVALSPSLVINNSSVNETLLKLATSEALNVDDYIKMVFSSKWQDASISFSSDGLDYFLKLGIDNQSPYLSIGTSNVLVNDTLQVTGNEEILSTSTEPLRVRQTTAMGANNSKKILIGDINNQTAVGYYIDANNNPVAYLKLFNKSAEVDVAQNQTTITNTGNNNTLMITNTTYTGNLALMKMHQTNLASGSFTCFDLGTPTSNVYARFKYYYHSTAANRFYSIIMDGVEVFKVFTDRVQIESGKKLTMNHNIDGSCTSSDYTNNTNIDDTHVATSKALQAQIASLQNQINNIQSTLLQNIYRVGSLFINAYDGQNPANILGFGTWAQLPDNYFLMSVTGGGGGYGGNNTHTHSYGMRWGGWYNTLTGIGDDALSFFNNGGWTDVAGYGGTISSYHPMFNALSIDSQTWYQALVSAGPTTALPAHFKVYVWCRTA